MLNKHQRALRPIALKLIIIIIAIVLAALLVSTKIITNIIKEDVRVTAENNNYSLNQHAASETEIFLNSIITNTSFIINVMNSRNSVLADEQINSLFDGNRMIGAISVSGFAQLLNTQLLYPLGIDDKDITTYIKEQGEFFSRAENGETIVLNASPYFNANLLALIMPLELNGETSAVLVIFSPESLAETFSSETNEAMLVNTAGDILISSNLNSSVENKSIKDTQIYSIVFENKSRQQQLVYKGKDGSEYFVSYYKLLSDEIAVVTQIKDKIVFEALQTALRRNLWLELTLLFSAVLVVWFVSKTISVPIEELTEAVKCIEQGQFDVSIKKRTHDELLVLAESIEQMGQGLAERGRLKETFGRFINTEIAERAMRGELKLGGENRKVTIFFTDIRSFTAKAEKMKPEALVAFLNRYLERMVECVTQTGGCVDKFIGDSIMAVWGAPLAGESPKANALAAVTTALMMRNALIKFNEEEKANNREPIQFGCGISSGDVTAGQIGSKERMEYTVIGDTVNLASRIEAINKPLCTDILISEQTYKFLKDDIIVEEMPSFAVKGKSKPVRLFAVIALKNTVNTPLENVQQASSLKEVRSMLGLEEPDLAKVDINEEEKKYSIQKL